MEPASFVAKAWDHAERIAHRACVTFARTLLVTGAGPIGFLAALLGRQRGLDVHIFDRAERGPKLDLTRGLGAQYHNGDIAAVLARVQPDIVMECTGAAPVIAATLGRAAPNGIVCLLGVSAAGRPVDIDIGLVNRTMVLENQVVFGAVNANRIHYEAAAGALAGADRDWLSRVINRRVPLQRWHEALEDRKDDIKVVIEFELLSRAPSAS
jgi:threonine dehydrogenase-like Zn-dependent dehydrogenase